MGANARRPDNGDHTRGDHIRPGAEELRKARSWLHSDEALMGAGRPLPGTRVGALIDMLEPDEDDEA
jgi:hypothetical protein